MNKLTLASLISAILVAPAMAAAANKPDVAQQNPTTMTSGDFATLDTNQDGFISQDEADEDKVWTYFATVDADSDGQLSPTEFESYISNHSQTDVSHDSDTAEQAANANALTVTDEPVSETKQAQHESKKHAEDVMDSADVNAQMTSGAEDQALKESMDESMDESLEESERYSAREPVAPTDIQGSQDNASSKHAPKNALETGQSSSQDTSAEVHSKVSATVSTKAKSASMADASADVDNQAAHQDAEQMTTEDAEQPIPADDFPYVEDEEIEDSDAKDREPTGLDGQDASQIAIDKANQLAAEQKNAEILGQPGAISPTEREFSSVDVDKDGYIDQDEARSIDMTPHFSEADKDQDDRISEAEYKSYTSANVKSH